MSDPPEVGVLYTEHSDLRATTPIASLWSFETRTRPCGGRSVTLNADGSREYWLKSTDPLLNTILPGTGISLIVNFGDPWASGRSLVTSEVRHRPRRGHYHAARPARYVGVADSGSVANGYMSI